MRASVTEDDCAAWTTYRRWSGAFLLSPWITTRRRWTEALAVVRDRFAQYGSSNGVAVAFVTVKRPAHSANAARIGGASRDAIVRAVSTRNTASTARRSAMGVARRKRPCRGLSMGHLPRVRSMVGASMALRT